MNSTVKKVLYIGIPLVTAGIIVFVFRKNIFGTKVDLSKLDVPEKDTAKTGSTITWGDDNFPLKLYSRGNKVKALQQNLNKKLVAATPAGVSSPANPASLTAMNKIDSAKVTEDGFMGAKTVALMKSIYGVDQMSEAMYNKEVLGNYLMGWL